jgi:hypothetical protein
MSIRRKAVACALGATLAAGAAVGVAGCGSATAGRQSGSGGPAAGDRTAATLVAQMKAAVTGATSMHLTEQRVTDGRPVGLDLGVLKDGGLTGSITRDGVREQLIAVRGRVYVKATPGFLRELRTPATVCAAICGKYVQMSGARAGEVAAGLSLASLTGPLVTGLPKFTRAGTATVGGQPVIVLHGSDGSTLDVAARGQPYPLRIAGPDGRDETVLFSRWDAVAAPTGPPAGEVISPSRLKAASR